MDIISHGLWGAAAAKGLNIKIKNSGNKVNLKAAMFWGMFPDLFAFTVPFILIFYGFIFGNGNKFYAPRIDEIEPASKDTQTVFKIAHFLYNISHSAIVFIIIFAVIFLIFKKINYSMLAWPLHILMDIPTHSYKFFPTPVFWPVSEWKFRYGFSWANIWFEILNYSLLIIIFIFLKFKKKKNLR